MEFIPVLTHGQLDLLCPSPKGDHSCPTTLNQARGPGPTYPLTLELGAREAKTLISFSKVEGVHELEVEASSSEVLKYTLHYYQKAGPVP